ncbi:mucin-17 isoform X2 [Engraulis encrasicolus]|uniref:mucin-17 isoform X2 n=1 Tax=Engraulis encrasicolus TaxID=184585 RepID=UPI002FD31890
MPEETHTELLKVKDEELDKKIEALRRKNEMLMKRYQEVEEDKKKAEKEGMALSEDQSGVCITINKGISDLRLGMKSPGSGGGSPQERSPKDGGETADGGGHHFGMGRGKRRQLFVTMVGNNKGTRVVSEGSEPHRPGGGGRKIAPEDEDGEYTEFHKKGKPGHSRKRNSQTQEDRGRHDRRAAGDAHWQAECDLYYQEPQPEADLTIPTSPEEQQEYLRWKAEREQIDRERVARHKNSQGQWRRAWDMDKPQLAFADKSQGRSEWQHAPGESKSAKKSHSKSASESQGHHGRGRERKGKKNVPKVVGSRAKGTDRLTGRARRWDEKDKDGNKQESEASLEEFLEELDALCEPNDLSADSEMCKNSDMIAPGAGNSGTETGSITLEKKCAPSPAADEVTEEQRSVQNITPLPKATPEKKVRFSEELVQGATSHILKNASAVAVETKGSSLKAVPVKVKVKTGVGVGAEGRNDSTGEKTPQQTEDQDNHDTIATHTKDCHHAAVSSQHEEEEKKPDEKKDEKVTDNEESEKKTQKTQENAKQPEGEAEKLSTASHTEETGGRVPTIDKDKEAPTPQEQSHASQVDTIAQAANANTNTPAGNTKSPVQQAPNTQALNTQPVEAQNPITPTANTQPVDTPNTEAANTQPVDILNIPAPNTPVPTTQPVDTQDPNMPVPNTQPVDTQEPNVSVLNTQPVDTPNTLVPNTQPVDTQEPNRPAPNTQPVDTQEPNIPVPKTQPMDTPNTEAANTHAPAHQGPEHTKTSTSRATEELLDSSLSVLNRETCDTHPHHLTSTEKAREDGKVV